MNADQPERDDHAALTDAANEQLTPVRWRWRCVYCWQTVPFEWSVHCGEMGHTEAFVKDDDDDER